MRKVGFPACERQICLADVSVRVLRLKRRQDKSVFHTLEPENPTFLMTVPVEKPSLSTTMQARNEWDVSMEWKR